MLQENGKERMEKTENENVTKGQPSVTRVAVFSFIACLGAIMMGFNGGYATQTLNDLESNNGSASIKSSDTTAISLFTAIFPLSALFGGLVAGWGSDILGRKPAIIVGGAPQLAGWLVITVAHIVTTNSAFFLGLILFGRFLAGFGAGWNSLCIPVFITEISPVSKRGFFGSWNQLFVTVGVLSALCLGINVSHFHIQYYYVSVVAMIIIAIFLLGMAFVDESPVWLIARGKLEKGREVLGRLRGKGVDVTPEVDEIARSLAQLQKASLAKTVLLFRKRHVMVPFLLSLVLMLFQQFSGVNALLFNATQQLQLAGLSNASLVAGFTVGGAQVLFNILGVPLVETLGRKVLLTVSSLLMVVSSLMLATDFYVVSVFSSPASVNGSTMGTTPAENPVAEKYVGLAIAGVALHNAAFSLGWGPLPWVMMSELVPTSVRSLSGGVATAVNWGSSAFVSFVVNYYQEAVNPYGVWFTFGGFMVLGIFFAVFLVPETKGRSEEEIQQAFKFRSYRNYLFPPTKISDKQPLLACSNGTDMAVI